MNANRALLDELMGKFRNEMHCKINTRRNEEISWRNPSYCENYLPTGFCPWQNMHKRDKRMPRCRKKHNEIARMLFAKEPWKIQKRYWIELSEKLEDLNSKRQTRIEENEHIERNIQTVTEQNFCKTCGIFFVDKRAEAEHRMGRMHNMYLKLDDHIEITSKKLEKEKSSRSRSYDKERSLSDSRSSSSESSSSRSDRRSRSRSPDAL